MTIQHPTIAYVSPYPIDPWAEILAELLPDARFIEWPNAGVEPEEIEVVLCWKPEPGMLKGFPSAELIYNLGAGVDAILNDPEYPKAVPLIRMIDAQMTQAMAEYIIHWVLHLHRGFHVDPRNQAARVWKERASLPAHERTVAVMGLGELGTHAARRLTALDFSVIGWSQTQKEVHRVESYSGSEKRDAFLARAEILVNLLPLTDQTRNILNADTFAKMPKGAAIINVARGAHLVEDDLLRALDNGKLSHAVLDVFRTEPLPNDHAFWSHGQITVTPHIASVTPPESAARVVARDLKAWMAGELPEHLDGYVDLSRGY